MDPAARFAAAVTALLPEGITPGRPLALAVSGGPDSMAMLWLAARAFPGAVIAATVDHCLRPDSAAEAAMVAGWCRGEGVPHATLTVTGTPDDNLHAWARAQRYRLLGDWAAGKGAAAIATAHHADDQAETFLMRAARGSGLAGLAAIRPRTDGDGAPLIRPLLDWRRADLRALCVAQALPFTDDPANADPRFDRARFRAWLAAAPFDPAAMARSAAHLAEADRDLLAMSRRLHAERRTTGPEGGEVVDVAGLPRGVRRLIARLAIDAVRARAGIAAPGWSWAVSIEPLLDALAAGRAATQAGVLASANGDRWRFAAAPPRRSG